MGCCTTLAEIPVLLVSKNKNRIQLKPESGLVFLLNRAEIMFQRGLWS
jgi:hypothetical protein